MSSSSSSILIILLLLLSATILCLLLRLLNSHCLRQLSPSNSTAAAAPTATTLASSPSSNRVSPETPESLVLDYLPLFTFGTIKRRSSSGRDCAVCLSKFEQHDLLRLLPLCCHAFHASCIDPWLLESNQTCPLCRSPIHASDPDIFKALSFDGEGGGHGRAESFRLAIGFFSRSHPDSAAKSRTSYSLGSLDYVVEEEPEVPMGRTHRRSVSDKRIGAPVAQPVQEQSLAAEVAGGRSRLRESVDKISPSLSSTAHSFRSSGRFFTGSSRRSELGSAGDYDLEANRLGEEIGELFRWVSGV